MATIQLYGRKAKQWNLGDVTGVGFDATPGINMAHGCACTQGRKVSWDVRMIASACNGGEERKREVEENRIVIGYCGYK